VKLVRIVFACCVCFLFVSCMTKQIGDTRSVERDYSYVAIPYTGHEIWFPRAWRLADEPAAAHLSFFDRRIISTVYRGFESGDRVVSTLVLSVARCSFAELVQRINNEWEYSPLPISDTEKQVVINGGYLMGIEPERKFIREDRYGSWFCRKRILLHPVSSNLTISVAVTTKRDLSQLSKHGDALFDELCGSLRVSVMVSGK
jgi:hypothetical protein